MRVPSFIYRGPYRHMYNRQIISRVSHHRHISQGMGDEYNDASHAQYAAHRLSFPQLADAVETLAGRHALPGALRVTDLGSASGRNSIRTIIRIRDLIRKHYSSEAPVIALTLSDLPTSDFNALISTVDELMPSIDADGGMFVDVMGRSFYEQLFPSATVHLSTSFIAYHWVNGLPPNGAKGELARLPSRV